MLASFPFLFFAEVVAATKYWARMGSLESVFPAMVAVLPWLSAVMSTVFAGQVMRWSCVLYDVCERPRIRILEVRMVVCNTYFRPRPSTVGPCGASLFVLCHVSSSILRPSARHSSKAREASHRFPAILTPGADLRQGKGKRRASPTSERMTLKAVEQGESGQGGTYDAEEEERKLSGTLCTFSKTRNNFQACGDSRCAVLLCK